MNQSLSKPMARSSWAKFFLVLLLVCAFGANAIPFVDSLFYLPIADLCLLTAGSLAVGALSIKSFGFRAASLLVLWIFLSILRDIPHLPALLLGNDTWIHPRIVLSHPIESKSIDNISVEGDQYLIVSSLGHIGEVRPKFHPYGMGFEGLERSTDTSAAVDVVDEIWQRRFKPDIGSNAFPKVTIKVVDQLENFHIEIQVLSKVNEISGIYQRTLARPPKSPATEQNKIWNWVGNAFTNNLWRNLLGLRGDADLDRELSQFFDATLGRKQSGNGLGPLTKLKVSTDTVIPYKGDGSAPMYLYKLRSELYKDPIDAGRERYWEVCGVNPVQSVFGASSGETYVWGVPTQSPPYFNWLHSGWTDLRLLTFYCDSERQKVLIVSFFDRKPRNLKISTFSLLGSLEKVDYYEYPDGIPYPNLIAPASLKFSQLHGISFVSLHEIRSGQPAGQTADPDKYRSIEVTTTRNP